MFARLDLQATGWIDAKRFVAHRPRRFGDYDPVGDGGVSSAEPQRMHPGLSPAARLTRYRRRDWEGVGRFSQHDWNAAQLARFLRIDADADGIVRCDAFLTEQARICALREAAARP